MFRSVHKPKHDDQRDKINLRPYQTWCSFAHLWTRWCLVACFMAEYILLIKLWFSMFLYKCRPLIIFFQVEKSLRIQRLCALFPLKEIFLSFFGSFRNFNGETRCYYIDVCKFPMFSQYVSLSYPEKQLGKIPSLTDETRIFPLIKVPLQRAYAVRIEFRFCWS